MTTAAFDTAELDFQQTLDALAGFDAVVPGARIFRADASREAAAQLMRECAPIVVATGRSGSGRSAFAGEVAAVLAEAGAELQLQHDVYASGDPLARVNEHIGEVVKARTAQTTVITIDDFDLAADLGTRAPNTQLLDTVERASRVFEIRFLLIVNDRNFESIAEWHANLAEASVRVPVPEYEPQQLLEIVTEGAKRLVESSGALLPWDTVERALAPADARGERVHPGLAIDRIDSAIRRARLTGAKQVDSNHLGIGDAALEPAGAQLGPVELAHRLNAAVRGQSEAIRSVSERLAPALAGLTLRPERPHAVFLFAGPTGVGKTELAKQLAATVFGSEDALIRLDMSEFADEKDARFKLIGGSRIWKNSTTEGLLTTRVIERPRSVVLLDEFEKSDPGIWPLFLQVFDEGRLTDGWGQTASFAETIVVMTSNLGVREAGECAVGFGASQSFRADRQLDAIARLLPPELFGRITDTICFEPLSKHALRDLAELELARTAERLAASGWRLEYTAGVADWIAVAGYDPARGARYLQQAVERELFSRLAAAPSRHVRVDVSGAELVVEPLATIE